MIMNLNTVFLITLAAFCHAQTTSMNNRLGGTCINLPNLDTCGPGLVCLNSACRLASNPSTTTQRTRSTLVTTLTSPRTTISHTSSSVATIAPASDKNKAAKSTNVSIVPPVSKTGAIVGGICAVLSTVLIAGLVWFYRGPSGNDEDAQELKRKGEHCMGSNSRHYSTFNE